MKEGNGCGFTQAVVLGHTEKLPFRIEKYMKQLVDEERFTIETYDLLENNCATFCTTMCEFLLGHPIPEEYLKNSLPTPTEKKIVHYGFLWFRRFFPKKKLMIQPEK